MATLSEQEPVNSFNGSDQTKTSEDDHSEPQRKRARTSNVVNSEQKLRRVVAAGWNSLRKQSQKLTEKTYPHSPSFVCMHWMVSSKVKNGGKEDHQIVWEGPSHMRVFAEDPVVVQKFKDAATARRIGASENSSEMEIEIPLHSSNPDDFRNDQLRKLIPALVDPKQLKHFYGDPANKQDWYPQGVPFKSPNHVRGSLDVKRLTVVEMREVLRAFLDTHPDQNEPSLPGTGTENDDFGDEDIAIRDILCLSRELGVDLDPETKYSTVAEGLEVLERIKDSTCCWMVFELFAQKASELCLPATESRPKHDKVSLSLVDKRIQKDGFVVMTAGDDGNTLFNAVSMLLYSSEENASHLRLTTIIHAVNHLTHYVQMLESEMPDLSTVIQFVSVCATSPCAQDMPRGEGVLVKDLLRYLIQAEIRGLAQTTRAGFIPVMFLAGAIATPIQQHCVDEHELYTLLVPPCSCCETYKELVHIMWCRIGAASLGTYNCILPLLPLDTTTPSPSIDTSGIGMPPVGKCKEVEEHCLMMPHGLCNGSNAGKKRITNWAMCHECHSWYHCSCVGVSGKWFQRFPDHAFSCCKPATDNRLILQWPLSSKRSVHSVRVHINDVFSLYPNQGISDQVIDLFTRTMLPANRQLCVLSALTYEGIKSREGTQLETSLKELHKNANGGISLHGREIIFFPCKPKGKWHWLLVGANPSSQKAYIFDSLESTLVPWNVEIVQGIRRYLSDVLECDINLKEHSIEVSQQKNGIDCGIYVLHTLAILFKSTPSEFTDPTQMSALREPFDCVNFRKTLLLKIHSLSESYEGKQTLRKKKECDSLETVLARKIQAADGKGLKVIKIEGKGRGVVTTAAFDKDEFICMYSGEFISIKEAVKREKQYSIEEGSYMYYFKYKDKQLCIDATKEDGSMGRLINHSRKKCNIVPHTTETPSGEPVVYFSARRAIGEGEELLYDYGERDPQKIAANPWLRD